MTYHARRTRDETPLPTPRPPSIIAAFSGAQRAETTFASQLRKVARAIGDLIQGFADPHDPTLQQALVDYARIIEPWARSVTSRMIAEVDARDRDAWNRVSTLISTGLGETLARAPFGIATTEILQRATALITSLPIEAAERVRDLSTQAMIEGGRTPEVVAEIMRTGEVTKARANTIARTEVSRAKSVFNAMRAQSVGVNYFTWLTAKDSRVRPDHRILHGQVFRYDQPPIADQRTGARALPGQIYNCRCVALPSLDGL